MRRATIRRSLAGALAIAVLCAGCTVGPGDLAQYRRMRDEGPDARARETIACRGRDLTCARLVQMRGEACAQTMNDAALPPSAQQARRSCATNDARSLPGLLPADAPADDLDRANLLVFDTWLAMLADPATTADDMRSGVSALDSMRGGRPYAQTLRAEIGVFAILAGRADAAADCAALADAVTALPVAAMGPLAERITTMRTNIRSAQKKRRCVNEERSV